MLLLRLIQDAVVMGIGGMKLIDRTLAPFMAVLRGTFLGMIKFLMPA